MDNPIYRAYLDNVPAGLYNPWDDRAQRPAISLVQIVDATEPPLRFIASADALKVVEDKLKSVAAEIERWRTLTTSTDF